MNYLTIIKSEVLGIKNLLIILAGGFLYSVLAVLLLNYRLVWSTLSGSFPLDYKTRLLSQLYLGARVALSNADFILLIIISLLVGMNIAFLISGIRKIKEAGRSMRVIAGGSGILGIVSTGCTTCGLSMLSILGLGTGVSFLPWGSSSLYLLSIGALSFSILYIVRQMDRARYCEIVKKP